MVPELSIKSRCSFIFSYFFFNFVDFIINDGLKMAPPWKVHARGEEFTEFFALRRPYMRFEFPMPSSPLICGHACRIASITEYRRTDR